MTDQTDSRPRVIVEFTELETAELANISAWYLALCAAHGGAPPPSPLHAVLCACRFLHDRVQMLERVVEEAGITPTDYVANPEPPTVQ